MKRKKKTVPLSGKLALLVGVHKVGGQTEGAQAQSALGAPADIVNESDSLVVLALVVILVLDETDIHKVTHSSARVPAYVVGVDVDLL